MLFTTSSTYQHLKQMETEFLSYLSDSSYDPYDNAKKELQNSAKNVIWTQQKTKNIKITFLHYIGSVIQMQLVTKVYWTQLMETIVFAFSKGMLQIILYCTAFVYIIAKISYIIAFFPNQVDHVFDLRFFLQFKVTV